MKWEGGMRKWEVGSGNAEVGRRAKSAKSSEPREQTAMSSTE